MTHNRKFNMSKNNISPQNATDERAEQVLWDCLKEIPFIQVVKVEQRIIADPGKPEIVARIKVAERERLILAEVKVLHERDHSGLIQRRQRAFHPVGIGRL